MRGFLRLADMQLKYQDNMESISNERHGAVNYKHRITKAPNVPVLCSRCKEASDPSGTAQNE